MNQLISRFQQVTVGRGGGGGGGGVEGSHQQDIGSFVGRFVLLVSTDSEKMAQSTQLICKYQAYK